MRNFSLSPLFRWTFVLITLGSEFNQCFGQVAAEEPAGVVIDRVAVTLKSPENFKVPLELKSVTALPVVAPMDGIIQDVFVKVGDQVQQQVELLRLNSQELSLSLKRTQAQYAVAKLVVSQAAAGNMKALAEAHLEVAKRELDLAEFRLGQTILHAAITGKVAEILVSKGQFVRAGDLLARVIDPKQLMVEVPVERDGFDASRPFPLTIETQTTDAKVDAVLPALPAFAPLRELFVSVATARLMIDAEGDKFSPGQSVYSAMVPHFPIAEIPTLAVKTVTDNPDAERLVQVIRQGFVRNLPVDLLGQVGQTHVFVSARFVEGDELIISASEELKDGSWVRPMLVEEPQESRGGRLDGGMAPFRPNPRRF